MKEAALLASFLSLVSCFLSSERDEGCPASCRCEVRPWFSPRSVYSEANTVDCNNLGLSGLPLRLPPETQVLLLQTNNVVGLETTLEYLSNITEIDLSQNNISQVEDIRLGVLPRLLALHVEENWIQKLPDRVLASLPNLQEFYVNHNLISSIGPGAFQGLNRLLRLHLNSNRLRSVDSRWFQPLPNLEVLMLGENPVLQLSDLSFRPLTNLRSLVLNGMNLTEVPGRALVGLENLESLSFFDNLLSRVPRAALTGVPNLKFLDLNKNPIQRIQRGDFMDMMHLKELGVNNMPELVSIDGFALNNLPELTKVEATNNPRLSYVHQRALYRLPRLETLMLNSNSLSALHRTTVESLPNLREVGLHGNPIRCDCVVRWVSANGTTVRFMEPDALFCAEPPEYRGQQVRRVHFREMTEICLPLISPESLPARLEVSGGGSVSLHCRAFGEPEPDIYWVTPSGERVRPGGISGKYYMHPEGTFDIYDASETEAGSYTCVAQNLVGADLRSVTVVVDGHVARPSGRPPQVFVKSIRTRSVTVSWQRSGGSVSRLNWSVFHEDRAVSAPFATRLPADVRQYDIKRLKPSTRYRVCVAVEGAEPGQSRDCVNVTTRAEPARREETRKWDGLVMATCAVVFILVSVTCSVMFTSRYNRVFYRKLIADAEETSSSGVEVRATVINVCDV